MAGIPLECLSSVGSVLSCVQRDKRIGHGVMFFSQSAVSYGRLGWTQAHQSQTDRGMTPRPRPKPGARHERESDAFLAGTVGERFAVYRWLLARHGAEVHKTVPARLLRRFADVRLRV